MQFVESPQDTQVVARARSRSTIEGVGETLRAGLNALAALAPDGLSARTGVRAPAIEKSTMACCSWRASEQHGHTRSVPGWSALAVRVRQARSPGHAHERGRCSASAPRLASIVCTLG
jgi:hypothetical protein